MGVWQCDSSSAAGRTAKASSDQVQVSQTGKLEPYRFKGPPNEPIEVDGRRTSDMTNQSEDEIISADQANAYLDSYHSTVSLKIG